MYGKPEARSSTTEDVVAQSLEKHPNNVDCSSDGACSGRWSRWHSPTSSLVERKSGPKASRSHRVYLSHRDQRGDRRLGQILYRN